MTESQHLHKRCKLFMAEVSSEFFQVFKSRKAFRAGIIISALLSSGAYAENAHLATIDGGFRTTHGLSYTITTPLKEGVVIAKAD